MPAVRGRKKNPKPTRIQHAESLRKQSRLTPGKHWVDLVDLRRFPALIQYRVHVRPEPKIHGRTGELMSFDIDRQHHAALVDSMRGMTSPVQLSKHERPLVVSLKEPLELEGTRYAPGDLLLVEGVHRVAAAWTLGWRTIPVNRLDGTAEDVRLLLMSSNKKPAKAARSREDILKSLKDMVRQYGRLPSRRECSELLRVPRSTIQDIVSEHRADLGLETPEDDHQEDDMPHAPKAPTLSDDDLERIRDRILPILKPSGRASERDAGPVILRLAEALTTGRRDLVPVVSEAADAQMSRYGFAQADYNNEEIDDDPNPDF